MPTRQAGRTHLYPSFFLSLSILTFVTVHTAAAFPGSPVTEHTVSPLPYPEPRIPQSGGEESKGWPTDPHGWKPPMALQPRVQKGFSR